MRSVNGEAPHVFAENVEDLQVTYILKNGTSTSQPSNVNDVREVQIELQARNRHPDPRRNVCLILSPGEDRLLVDFRLGPTREAVSRIVPGSYAQRHHRAELEEYVLQAEPELVRIRDGDGVGVEDT